MRKILKSVFIILVVAAAAGSATYSFFSDAETSTGNTFTAGAIDLGIDNHSYYNGVLNPGTTWRVDYDIENTDQTGGPRQFFNFLDVKPADYGEDTISLHVKNNDSWLCADVTLTSNDDVDCNEPETDVEGTACQNDLPTANADGDLAQEINFLWWADDGDNVLEEGETPLPAGALGALGVGNTATVALADSDQNIWGTPGPLPGDTVRFVGKAWCFGTIAALPLVQDGSGILRNPSDNGDTVLPAGQPTDGGYTCDASLVGNESQTDSLTADIAFRAIQARHNNEFQCESPNEPVASLTLVKEVVGDGLNEATDAQPTDWTLSAAGPTPITGTTGSASVTNAEVTPGTYDLSEVGPPGYTASAWVCTGVTEDDADTVTLAAGQSATCTITNTENENLACTAGQQYANAAGTFDQGTRKDSSAVLTNRSLPGAAFGAPQTSGASSDVGFPVGSFVSLGFKVGSGPPHGSLVLDFFDNYVVDDAGADLKVYEVTGGVYPDEKVKVEVSQDGSTWLLAIASATRDASVNIAPSGLSWARYVRLTDVSDISLFPSDADAYDLDAIEALNCVQPQA